MAGKGDKPRPMAVNRATFNENFDRIFNKPKGDDMNEEAIAKVAHEINAAFCQAIGDNSQPDWSDAPDWQKESAVNGVRFHLENPNADASASHENWLKEKVADGWVYGEEKNPELKTHPCCVPYDELPMEQRAKDYLFKQTVHSLKGFLQGN